MCEENGIDEDKDWADIARISRENWAKENPYEKSYVDETGNESESFTIT